LSFKVLLALKVRTALQVLLPTLAVACAQVLPLSMDNHTDSSVSKVALKLPLMVWAAVLVLKSVALIPVSALKATAVMVVVGATRSRNKLGPVALTLLPAASIKRTDTTPPLAMAACNSAAVGVPSLVLKLT
jgi:hypothetical protein